MFALFLACAPSAPMFIDKAGIDKARVNNDTVAACAGLSMKDAEVRTYAAEKLSTWKRPQPCVCEHMVRDGGWDAAVLKGLTKVTEDERVACAGDLLDDAALPDRVGLARALSGFLAPAVRARLATAAAADADPEVRAVAIVTLRPDKDESARAILVAALADPLPSVRAAGATALAGLADTAPAVATLAHDPEPSVRAAALGALRTVKDFAFADVACAALASDTDATVRAAAATTMKGTKDPALQGCLGEHMLAKEDDALVRTAMLAALRGSSSKAAADTLCDAIPFWTRTYVGDGPVEKMGSTDIVGAHNDRDFERSYECTERAYKAGGYSCWQRGYLADYFREFGGKVGVPRCGGGAVSASNEITF